MKRTILCLTLIFCCFGTAVSQETDPVVLSYKKIFIKASLLTKADILRDAAGVTGTDMGPVFIDALHFSIESRPVLGNDPQLIDLAVLGVTNIIKYNPKETIPLLWRIFDLFPEAKVRIPVAESLGAVGAGDRETIDRLNTFLLEQAASPEKADSSVVMAVVKTLGKFGDNSSFAPLFRVITGNMRPGVIEAATAALNMITEKYAENIISLIRTESLPGKLTAFHLAMKNSAVSDILKGEIAETALKIAINMSESSQDVEQLLLLRQFRQAAILAITGLRWTRASPQVIRYFYMTQTDYRNKLVNADVFIESIECLGVMGTPEAAQTLSIYLGLLNSETEQNNSYNEQVVLAVIAALGALGDKIAFDYLLYVSYLPYSDEIIAASRDALGRLTW
ncbi:MAG: HEAT repeat domain-containing protein [Spirochaetaceae bacterium]|jgi:HEAT repeat protein|nr:HEAT repeat domain-containing protein [Spirochaetaceae bacterium]